MTTYEEKTLALLRLVEAKEKAAAASWGWAHTIAAAAFVVTLANFALSVFNARREIHVWWSPAKAEEEERTSRLVKAKLDKEDEKKARQQPPLESPRGSRRRR